MVKEAFNKLFVQELKDLLSAENQLIVALPKMAKAASSPELKTALLDHLEETKTQAERLKGILTSLNQTERSIECEAMKGLIREAEERLQMQTDSLVKDAAIIGIAQKVEHYEIAGYGTAKAFAKMLEYNDIADILDETLDEESNADKKLNGIAEGGFFTTGVNKKAISK